MKEECVGSSSSQYWDYEELIPQPLEAVLETGPPPFISKTYDFVDDPSTNELVSWSPGNNSFVVRDPQKFATNILPKYFKHNNFSSFVRQLNTYGFRKVDPDKWEFAHEGFLRGHRHLLKNIVRKKTQYSSSQTSNQSLGIGLDAEIDRLRCDKLVIETELVKHRQQQLTTLSWLRTIEHRLEGAKMKQKQTVSVLAKAIQNPTFLQQKLKQKDKKNDPDQDVVSNKRRRSVLDHVTKNVGVEESVFQEGGSANFSTIGNIGFQEIGQGSVENAYEDDIGSAQFEEGNFYMKLEPQEYGEILRFGDWKLEKLSVQKPQLIMEGKSLEKGEHKPIDEGFWEELINDGIEEIGTLGIKEDGDDLTEQYLGFLGSNLR
ncbi:heat stress transcription factor A-7a-like isoform X2 [Primulina eburnea]